MLKIIIAIVAFSAMILFHELGHFLLARKNGVLVEEFALGLGPTICGFKKGETKYSIKCLPFGGCCMMLGEDGESDDERALSNKSALARFSIIFAGPFFNFILAFVLALVVVGMSGEVTSRVGNVEKGSGAYESGIRSGDIIKSIDGDNIYLFKEIRLINMLHNDSPAMEIIYEREGVEKTVIVNRKMTDGNYMIGISSEDPIETGILDTLKYSLLEIRYQIRSTFMSLYGLIRGRFTLRDMSGPVGIVNIIGETYEKNIPYGIKEAALGLMDLMILLNANLGVMNLLPFPALDGGRLLFIIIEMIRRKKIDPDTEGRIHFVGLAMLLLLTVFICFNDIRNIL